MFSKKIEFKQRPPMSLEISHFSVHCSKALDLIQRLICVLLFINHILYVEKSIP